MKILLLLFNLFFAINFYAQDNRKIRILNKLDSTAIESANIFIDEKFVTSSDNQGYFSINKKEAFATIKISHVLFGTNSYSSDWIETVENIYLEEQTNNLEEVTINTKKNSSKFIFPEKDLFSFKSNGVSFPFNTEVAIYIPNDESIEDGFVKTIIIHTAKNQFIKKNNAKYVPFEVNLYSVDKVNGVPDRKIFKENIYAVRSEDEDNISLDISRLTKTPFPQHGIYVVIGFFNEKYYNEIGYFEKPSFKVVKRKKKSNFKEYHRRLIKGGKSDWKETMYSKIDLQCFYLGLEITVIK